MAVAIPVFTSSLHNAKWAADEANARSLYADATADFLANGANEQSDKYAVTIADNTITITESDGTTQAFELSGDTTVTFTAGANGVASKVTVTCNKNDDHGTETFGN